MKTPSGTPSNGGIPVLFFALGCEIARQLKRNGIFRSDWSRGLVVAAVDGIEICSSFARSCDHCMERNVKHTVNGELREELQYYHRIGAVTIVSSAFPIPLGLRFQKNGETEAPAAALSDVFFLLQKSSTLSHKANACRISQLPTLSE